MAAKDPRHASRNARIAALSKHAQGLADTSAATAGFLARFERQVDPDGTLPPHVRSSRARAALRVYMSNLAKRKPSPPPNHLDRLSAARRRHEDASDLLAEAVRTARQAGHTWQAIATTLGVSRQGAQQRWGFLDKELSA